MPETHDIAITAHRGASALYPENTRSAVVGALDLGVECVEFDVRRTCDGGLVILHDDRVDRISDGSGAVHDLTLDQVVDLDGGSWFDPAFAGERILTLEQILDLIPAPTRLNVHLKATDADRAQLVEAVVDQLVTRNLLRRAFITGAEPILLEARRRHDTIDICSNLPVPRCVEIDCRILQPSNSITTAELVAEAHDHSIEVHPFYADDPDEMRRLIDCGVDGFLTNDPQRALKVRQSG